MFELERILRSLRRRLPPERFRHSLQVMQLMGAAAPRYGLDPAQSALAGLLHDLAWHLPLKDMADIIRRNEPFLLAKLTSDKHDHAHLHGPAGAWVAIELYEVRDEVVFSAIHDHAGAFTPMALTTRCLYAADRLLPNADLPQDNDTGIALLLNGDLTELEKKLQKSPSRRSSCLTPRVRPSDPDSLLK